MTLSLASVAFVTEFFWPFEIGGAERSAAQLARALVAAGVRVSVLTPNYGAASREQLWNGVTVLRLPFPQKLRRGEQPRRLWVANPLIHAFYAFLIARHVRRVDANVIHVQNSPLVIAAGLACRLIRRPLVITVRDLSYVPQESRSSPNAHRGSLTQRVKWTIDRRYSEVERRLKLFFLSRAASIIFVSGGLLAYYQTRAFEPPNRKTRIIHNIGPDVTGRRWQPGPTPRVLYVGKLSAGKGVPDLLAAVPLVRREIADVTFDIVGAPGVGFTPPAAGNSTERLFFRGVLRQEQILDLMANASVLVSPSRWPEPLSRVLLEATGIGVPIVATCVGGTQEIVGEHESALLVPPNAPDALAAAIVRVITDRPLAERLSRAGRERFANLFSANQVVPQVLEAYRSGIEQ